MIQAVIEILFSKVNFFSDNKELSFKSDKNFEYIRNKFICNIVKYFFDVKFSLLPPLWISN